MTQLDPRQVYDAERRAGFTPGQAVTLDAIAGAESHWQTPDPGDVGLQTDVWGPSVGVFQIRTLKAETGTGRDRDIAWLESSLDHQAKAAYDISHGGTDWTPWTTYNTGAYRTYLAQAQAAAGGAAPSTNGPGNPTTVAASSSDPLPTWGPAWLPWNWLSDAGNAAADTVKNALSGARNIVIEGAFVVLGLGLVGVGVWRISKGGNES